MQSKHGFAASNEDVAAYVAAMSRQLAEVCALAGMCKAARLLEEAASTAVDQAGQGNSPENRPADWDQESSSESRSAASPPG